MAAVKVFDQGAGEDATPALLGIALLRSFAQALEERCDLAVGRLNPSGLGMRMRDGDSSLSAKSFLIRWRRITARRGEKGDGGKGDATEWR